MLAEILRRRGYDAIHVWELGRTGKSKQLTGELMLDGKLRIAPTCYHVLHLLPVMAAHEMNFFYDAGLKTADGSLGYQIQRDAMVRARSLSP